MSWIVVYDEGAGVPLIEPEPECGVDYCEKCGDSLYWHGDDRCHHSADHLWVISKKRREQSVFFLEWAGDI